MTVEHLLRTMSGQELREWRQFIEIERGGGISQAAIDTDDKIKSAFATLCTPSCIQKWPNS